MTTLFVKLVDGIECLHIFVYDSDRIPILNTEQVLEKIKHIATFQITKSGSYYKIQMREYDNNVIFEGEKRP